MPTFANDVSLPDGIVREAAAPERIAIIWNLNNVDAVLDVLKHTSVLAIKLDPVETQSFIEVSGRPSYLLVESDLIDDELLASIDAIRAACGQLAVVLLAGNQSIAEGLLKALQAGITNVVDPDQPDRLHEILGLRHRTTPLERVLAVGAHPDDVEIGCGATLLRHRDDGHPVTVLTLSRGAVGGPRDARRQEAIASAIAMSAELLMGDHTDTRMGDSTNLIEQIEGVIAVVRPSTVYVHSLADNHQDHRAVHNATVVAARRVEQVFCYQSPSSRNEFAPTKFVPVEETIEEKVGVLKHYRTQATRHYLDPELVVATARYWARQLPHARYAEPYEVIRATNLT